MFIANQLLSLNCCSWRRNGLENRRPLRGPRVRISPPPPIQGRIRSTGESSNPSSRRLSQAKVAAAVSIGYFVIALILLFALQTLSISSRSKQLRIASSRANEEGTPVECRHRRENDSRRHHAVSGQPSNEYSEETARIVDEEIKRLLTDAHQKVRSYLSSCKDALEEVAQLLLEKEVVERPALQSILKAKMTKDARDVMQRGQSPSERGPIGKLV